MPAKKPQALNVGAYTNEVKAARAKSERALRPLTELPKEPPAQLDGHDVARAAYRRLMRIYGELEAKVITRLDMDMLVDYCLLIEQVIEMDETRKQARAAVVESGDTEEAIKALEMVVKVDARADRKRALLFQLRQSLYLTPRSRAGVTPDTKKPPEPAKDPLEAMLEDVDLG